MRDLFSQSADLSGMTGQRDIQVSDIFHKALVEINEEGTIAAASSGIVVVPLSLSYPSPETIFVRADHPFIFFIYDFETSQVLFMGRIMDPRPESSVPPSLSNMQSWPQTGSSSFTFPPRKQSWSQQTSSAFTFPPGKQSWSQLGSTALTYPSMNPLRTETEADDINNRQPSRSQSVPFSSHLSSNPSTARIYTQWFDSPQHKWPYMYRVPQNPQLVFLRSRVYRSPFTPVFQRHKMLKRRYEDQPIHPQ
ncbi:unnamed protein product [Darwinula stevensoni]|uniref:Serpin domain-containing protein n=1 Tax=Darwinula stevensoni TaxID=69355 RepID=A0A7R9A963_9CRUS|nr:unnamed protein product [Darwinula stevensoni]CAG0896913.1 unnamed protein product [Darwinula stevensoni]